jgi:predicted DNA-binding transcriptional regulator YafY
VQRAVVKGRQAILGYVASDGAETTRVVHPLGLAVKGSVWYLLAGTERGQRTFRVDRICSVELSDQAVERPTGFDVADAWSLVAAELEERRAPCRARAMVDPDSVSLVRWVFGNNVRIGPAADDGRIEVELRSSSSRALAGQISGFGNLVEVIEPNEIRQLLAGIARELSETYLNQADSGA